MDIREKFNIHISGKGTQPMLFAHGFGCDQNVWRYMTPSFEDDYQIILFDYVGAGKSFLKAYDYEKYNSLQGYADDIIEICKGLDLKDVIFVGHSVSSMIGLLAANKEPQIFSRLVMIGPSPSYINELPGYKGGFNREDLEGLFEIMDSNYLGWSQNLAPAIMGNPDRPELGEELTQNFCSTDPDIARHFARATFFSDNRKDVSQNKVDVLILQCSDDIIAPNEVGEYLHQNMPKSSFKKLNATGHCPHMSYPEETIAALKDFLNE